jgi:hypothetical protein
MTWRRREGIAQMANRRCLTADTEMPCGRLGHKSKSGKVKMKRLVPAIFTLGALIAPAAAAH